jgi:DNA-binding NarL/FixJ family response regulator
MNTSPNPDLQPLHDLLATLDIPSDPRQRAAFERRLERNPKYGKAGPVRVMLVEPEPMNRLIWRRLIAEQMPAFRVCVEAETVARARSAWVAGRPEVVILDPDLDGGAGWKLLRELAKAQPEVSCQVLLREGHVRTVPEAMQAGACVVNLRTEEPQNLLTGLLLTGIGLPHVSCAASLALGVAITRSSPGESGSHPALRGRKAEVFALLGHGYSSREIADRVGGSIKTVQTHLDRLKRELRASSLDELRRRAILARRGG